MHFHAAGCITNIVCVWYNAFMELFIFDLGEVILLDVKTLMQLSEYVGTPYRDIRTDYGYYDRALMDGYMDPDDYYRHLEDKYQISIKEDLFRKFFTLLAVFTMWFSAGIIPMYMTFRDFNLLDTRIAIIFGFSISTYNMIILKSFFEQVPASLEEAAFIDGASDFRIFAQVYLPLSKPSLATVALFYAVNRWNGYFWPMNLLTSDEKVPLQVLLKKLLVDRTANEMESAIITAQSLTSQTTVIYALIILAIIPMAIAYPFIQKYFKSGITLGANKG